MKNSKKFSLISGIVFCLAIVEECCACGGCYRNFLWNKTPIYLSIFFAAMGYGVIVYVIFWILRIFRFKICVVSLVIFLVLSYISYFISAECMLGPPSFITSTALLYIAPWLLFFFGSPGDGSKIINKKTRFPLLLIPAFIIVSLVIGLQWQSKVNKYFDDNLIEMLEYRTSLPLNYAAMKKLMAIENKDAQAEYLVDLERIATDKRSYHHNGFCAAQILAKWQGKDAIPIEFELLLLREKTQSIG